MKMCPLLKKDCIENKCMWWVEMIAKNVKTGEMETANNCAISKIPTLLVEELQNTRGIQASVESSRNETVARQEVLLHMIDGAQRRELADPNR